MNQLYKKSELIFSIVWILIYVFTVSMADNLQIGVLPYKTLTAIICGILTIILVVFLKKNNLFEKYGLCAPKISAKKMLYFIPLLVIISVNLWFGISVENSIVEILMYVISMILVGFIEEIIFRGFLFVSLLKDSRVLAITISSVTFGIGHMVNLINGSGMEVISNIFQVIDAMASGFLFTVIFYKTKSIWPCIITHGLVNSLSIFASAQAYEIEQEIVVTMVWTCIAVIYGTGILKLKE